MPDPAAEPPPATPALTPKAEQTRRAIADAALRLFGRDGYDRTTMRAVAAEAGVSVGNAYYYFGSKEHLIQAFYDRSLEDHTAACAGVLARETRFADRLRGVLEAWVDVAAPTHAFAVQFFRNAADPESPLSPFSAESAPARTASIGLYEQVVTGSDVRLSVSLRAQLPELLWLMQMGVVLFWVHDRSPDQRRTRALVAGIVPLVDRVVRLSRLPVLRGLVDDLTGLIATLRAPD